MPTVQTETKLYVHCVHESECHMAWTESLKKDVLTSHKGQWADGAPKPNNQEAEVYTV